MIPRPPQTIRDIYTVDSVDEEPLGGQGTVTRIKLIPPTRVTPEPDLYIDLYLVSGGGFSVQIGDMFDVNISPRKP